MLTDDYRVASQNLPCMMVMLEHMYKLGLHAYSNLRCMHLCLST